MSYLQRIRNRDGVLPDLLYRLYKSAERANMPRIPLLYDALAFERMLRQNVFTRIKRKLYDEPLFRAQCAACGNGLNIADGIPLVWGGLELRIGENVTLHGTSTFSAAKVFDRPRLTIGDRTHLGSRITIAVGADVTIGNDVLIANLVHIFAYDGHPVDAHARRQNLPAPRESSRPIIIEDDAWIGSGAFILKGVTIGRGAIVAAASVVVDDVPAWTIVAGNPARVVRRLAGGENGSGADETRPGAARGTG